MRNNVWLHLDDIEKIFKEAAALLKEKGVKSEIKQIRCGTPGFELIVRDEDENVYKYFAFHGGSHGTLLCFGRSQRYDVVTAKKIAQAFIKRL